MIDRIDHIVLNCHHVETTASWHERALGFKREICSSPAAPGQCIALKFDKHKFNLRLTRDADWRTCKVDAPGSLDPCFVTEASRKPVIARLAAASIPVIAGPVPRTGALGPMTSIYCEDPDGNLDAAACMGCVQFWLVNAQPEIAEEKRGVRPCNARALSRRGVSQVDSGRCCEETCTPFRGVSRSGTPFYLLVRGLWA